VCFFTPNERQRTTTEFTSDIALAIKAYGDALQNARIEGLPQKHSGWGVAGDILYAALSASLLFGVEALAVKVGMKIGAYLAEGGSIADSAIETFAARSSNPSSSVRVNAI
jgi:hypothetical protein